MSILDSTKRIDPRQQRGQEIAATTKLRMRGALWVVPSQAKNKQAKNKDAEYLVDLTRDTPRCTCPDNEMRQVKCKHIYAVEYTMKREVKPDGTTTVTATTTVSKTVRVTYKQDWPAYNAAQTHEGERFPELLHALCQGVVQPPQTNGRPRLSLADMVFCSVSKVYGTMSGRRSMSDMRQYEAKGYVSKAPCFNSISGYLDNPLLTPILKAMIEESASPLKAIETDFAVDSSAFSTCRFLRWYDEKYGKMRTEHEWVKVHLMSGVKTNVVTSVEITDGNAHDSPFLPPLLQTTTARFQVSEVSADKGYIGHKNLQAIVDAGAVPYIPFKSNVTGEGPELWRRMYHYYMFSRDCFLEHYHKRSNVETTFSMIKGKFGDALRSKSDTAQRNEALCKVLCHNICVLIQSIYELKIEPTFWSENAVAQKSA
jgi:transposase